MGTINKKIGHKRGSGLNMYALLIDDWERERELV
jgi:hypothetical protein